MDRRYVRLDPKKLEYLRLLKGIPLDDIYAALATENLDQGDATLDKRRVKAALAGEKVFVRSAKIVADFLGAANLVAVLHPDLLPEIGPPSTWGTPLDFFARVGEWDVLECLDLTEQASNGLRYDVWKLRHRDVRERFGRGKCYDLQQLSSKDRTRSLEHLTRHCRVCDKVGPHPHIAQNRSAQAWDQAAWWWVIDDWIEGRTLQAALG